MGAVLRTREATKLVYISQGHRISLEHAVDFARAVIDGFRIPRPTREADHFVEQVKREMAKAVNARKVVFEGSDTDRENENKNGR